jgi:hypothetical protein
VTHGQLWEEQRQPFTVLKGTMHHVTNTVIQSSLELHVTDVVKTMHVIVMHVQLSESSVPNVVNTTIFLRCATLPLDKTIVAHRKAVSGAEIQAEAGHETDRVDVQLKLMICNSITVGLRLTLYTLILQRLMNPVGGKCSQLMILC